MPATLVQLSTSPGGMPKRPVAEALITRDGVAGDWQRNRKYHGGPDRAVCLYSAELYDWLADQDIRLAFGAVGENFTTRGIELQALAKGDRLRVGGACVIELTDVRVPCNSLKKWAPDLPRLIVGRSGWVARVVTEGTVRAGDPIRRIPRRTVHPTEETACNPQRVSPRPSRSSSSRTNRASSPSGAPVRTT